MILKKNGYGRSYLLEFSPDDAYFICAMENESLTELYRGIGQFNDGQFFDCHDTIEGVWIDIRGSERLFYQGLIQVAVAYYHAGNGNFSGAMSQLTKAIAKLEQFPDVFLRVHIHALLPAIRLHRIVFRSAIERSYNPLAARELKAPQIIVH